MAIVDKPCRTCGEVKEMHMNTRDCVDCKKNKDSIGQQKIREYNRNYRKNNKAKLAGYKRTSKTEDKFKSEFERITGKRRDTSCDKSGFF